MAVGGPGQPDVLVQIRNAYQEAKEQAVRPRFRQEAGELSDGLQFQQALGEQQVQSALTQATTWLAGTQQVERIASLARELQSLDGDSDPTRTLLLLQELKSRLFDHQQAVQGQVAQALCQALLSMAQSQLAQFQCQEVTRLWERVLAAEESLQWVLHDRGTGPTQV